MDRELKNASHSQKQEGPPERSLIHQNRQRSRQTKVYYSGTEPEIFFRFVSPVTNTGIPLSTSPCGRGITWTAVTVPTFLAAAAPASTAAFTAPTSPRTIAVTNPASTFSYPTSYTFAAFTIESAASIIATKPKHSTIPRACIDFV